MSNITIGAILDNKKLYSVEDIVNQILKQNNISNIYQNYARVESKLNDVLKRHNLFKGEDHNKDKFYSQIQIITFQRELAPEIAKMNWNASLNHISFDERLYHLGEDLNKSNYNLDYMIDYVIRKMDLANDQPTRDSLMKQIRRIMRVLGYENVSLIKMFSPSCTYLIIDMLKPFLKNHNYTRIDHKLKDEDFNYLAKREYLAQKYNIQNMTEYLSAFDAINKEKFNKIQIDRERYKDNPEYLTDHEVEKLDEWTKHYALSTDQQITKLKEDEEDKAKAKEKSNSVVKTKEPPKETETESKQDTTKPKEQTKKTNSESKKNKIAKDQSYKFKDLGMLDGFDDDSNNTPVKPKSVFDLMEQQPINKKPEKPWQTNDTSILTANPFSTDDQIKVLLKRKLLEEYNIDTISWKADQEALSQLDYRTQAYANIYQRLLHPEINYVTRRK